MRSPGREESTASWLFITAITFGNKSIFPVRNRLRRVGPDRSSKNATRKIVNGHVDLASNKHVHGFGELVLIIHRVNPKKRVVRDCEPSVFQSHQRDVVNKWQIA